MRVAAVETLRHPDYANILWVRLHADDGRVGLGETFRGAAAVEAQIHAEIAPRLAVPPGNATVADLAARAAPAPDLQRIGWSP